MIPSIEMHAGIIIMTIIIIITLECSNIGIMYYCSKWASMWENAGIVNNFFNE